MLGGVVGRWGIASRVTEGVLPRALRDSGGSSKAEQKISEIVEEKDGVDVSELEAIVKTVLVLRVSRKTGSEGRRQLAGVVSPQL